MASSYFHRCTRCSLLDFWTSLPLRTLALALLQYFAFAVSPWSYDPDYMHCYPVSFDGDGRYPSPEQEDTCTTITHVVPENSSAVELAFVKVDRSGGDSTNSCCNACNAMDGCTAWMMDRVNGPGGNNCHLYSCVEQWVPPDVSGGNDGKQTTQLHTLATNCVARLAQLAAYWLRAGCVLLRLRAISDRLKV